MKNIIKILLASLVLLSFQCKDDPNGPKPQHGSDTTSHDIIWEIDTVGEFMSDAQDIWGAAPDDIWIVGYFQLENSPGASIMHFNGNKWEKTDYLEAGLVGIYGFSKNNVWAVGESYLVGFRNALVAHWDGIKWKTVHVDQSRPLLTKIWGSSPTDIFAVGAEGTILHYDGAAWNRMESGDTMDLKDVWGSGPKDVYACGGDKLTRGILLHYDGVSWKNITDSTLAVTHEIKSVWGSDANNVQLSTSPGHFIGNYKDGWKSMYIPDDNTYLTRITGTAANNIFVVGHFGMALHYNGNSWQRYDQFYQKPNPFYGFYSASIVGNTVLVVGYESKYSKSIVLRGTQQ